jgi:hypothetical protein
MILDRLGNGGVIKDDYKLDCAKRGKRDTYAQALFVMEKPPLYTARRKKWVK